MYRKNILFLTILSLLFVQISFSKDNITNPNDNNNDNGLRVVAAGCLPATSSTELNINNVRTLILGSGDMWWDLSAAQYEVPKDGNIHSIFAGALWIGGLDDANNLKVGAMTYRSSGVDFFRGH